VVRVREVRLPADREGLRRLWVEYLEWANAEMAARHGFRIHDPEPAVARDLDAIARFLPPNGHLLVGVTDAGSIVGVGGLRRLAPIVAEVKRMYIAPTDRGRGLGGRILAELIRHAISDGYERVRLDSPAFMTNAHALYRRAGFREIAPYPESEIPDEFKPHARFMELDLTRRFSG
jgi:ribosomal protein S18 acetylase RimI-like enzyme